MQRQILGPSGVCRGWCPWCPWCCSQSTAAPCPGCAPGGAAPGRHRTRSAPDPPGNGRAEPLQDRGIAGTPERPGAHGPRRCPQVSGAALRLPALQARPRGEPLPAGPSPMPLALGAPRGRAGPGTAPAATGTGGSAGPGGAAGGVCTAGGTERVSAARRAGITPWWPSRGADEREAAWQGGEQPGRGKGSAAARSGAQRGGRAAAMGR